MKKEMTTEEIKKQNDEFFRQAEEQYKSGKRRPLSGKEMRMICEEKFVKSRDLARGETDAIKMGL
jgi:tRNA A37 methylthiotransferase MiaB